MQGMKRNSGSVSACYRASHLIREPKTILAGAVPVKKGVLMYADLIFDCLQFQSMSLQAWKRRYGSSIRAIASLDRIKKSRVRLEMLDSKMAAYGVWYSKGDWMDGVPKRIKPGDGMALVRVPAVKWLGAYMLPDGMHRIQSLNPRWILMDVLEIQGYEHRYFGDFANPFWQKRFQNQKGKS